MLSEYRSDGSELAIGSSPRYKKRPDGAGVNAHSSAAARNVRPPP